MHNGPVAAVIKQVYTVSGSWPMIGCLSMDLYFIGNQMKFYKLCSISDENSLEKFLCPTIVGIYKKLFEMSNET